MKTIRFRSSRPKFDPFILATIIGLALGPVVGAQEPEADEAPKNPANAKAETLEDLLKQAEVDPLEIPKNSITTAEYNKQRFAWLQRALVPAMKKEFDGALETPAKLAVVDKLLGWWVDTDSSMVESIADATAFAKEVNELAAPSAKMPVFQAIAGLYIAGVGRKPEAMERWRTTLALLDPDSAPALAGLIAMGGLAGNGAVQSTNLEAGKLYAQLLRAALTPEQCPEGDVPCLMSFLTTYQFNPLIKPRAQEVLGIVKESKLPAWAREYLTGLCEVQIAWRMRGGGVASKVTEAGWRGFEEHLTKARTALAESWKLRPDRPEAAAEMITVAMGGHTLPGETTRFWFNRAIAAQCDYPPAYEKMRWSLRPRWGGSPLEMAAFGMACTRVDRPDSKIGEQLSHALIDLATELGDWRPLFADKTLGGALVETRKKFVARARTPYEIRVQNSLLALEAWLSGQFALATTTLEKTGDPRKRDFPISAEVNIALRRLKIDSGDFVKDCRLRGGRFGEAYLSITEAREKDEHEAAAKQAAELLKDADAKLDPVLLSLGPLTTFELDFSKADWVKIPLMLYVWRSNGASGAWYHFKDELGFASPGFPARILFHGDLGDRYEVRAELALAKNREKSAFGIVFGATGVNTNDSYTFSFVSQDGKATTMNFSRDNLKVPNRLEVAEPWPLPGPEKTVAVRIRREKNELSIWLDDQLILDKKTVPEELHAGQMGFGFIGAGGVADDRHMIRKLEARKLGISL